MARVTPKTITENGHSGKCQTCEGASDAAWSGGIELCRNCIATMLPAMLVDALKDCEHETVYKYRERERQRRFSRTYRDFWTKRRMPTTASGTGHRLSDSARNRGRSA